MSQELSEFDTHVSRRYEMEKRLGRGAYGIVWKAKSKRSGRVVCRFENWCATFTYDHPFFMCKGGC